MNKSKETYVRLLRSTERNGIDNVLQWLDNSDFYTAPASTNFHGNYAGGLLEHSMNVAKAAIYVREFVIKEKPELEDKISRNSVVIAALLHDICKANIYRPETKYKKDAENKWINYEGYSVDYSELPIGHGEKSVVRLLRLGLDLTDDEIMAIRWHMSAWDLAFQSAEMKSNFNVAKDKYPLLTIIQAADGIASSLWEYKVEH